MGQEIDEAHFDADGLPHLRIEHRVVPAGPTIVDSIVNAALFYGMLVTLLRRSRAIESELPFAAANANFYAAARHGLDPPRHWPGAKSRLSARELLTKEVLPAARAGMAWLGIPSAEIEHYLGVIEGRLAKDQTGAR